MIKKVNGFGYARSLAVHAGVANHCEDIAIDLGTAYCSLYTTSGDVFKIELENLLTKERYLTSQIPTYVTMPTKYVDNDPVDQGRREEPKLIVATGQDAYEMVGRISPDLSSVRAVIDGNIANQRAYRAISRHVINLRFPDFHRKFKGTGKLKPRILGGVPQTANSRNKEYIREIFERDIGAREAFLVYEQIADAIGAGIKLEEPEASIVANSGGGTLDIAVVCFGKVVHSKSYQGAGDAMDLRIRDGAKSKGAKIGLRTARYIKEYMGSAMPFDPRDFRDKKQPFDTRKEMPTSLKVSGSSIATEEPMIVDIDPDEVRLWLKPEVEATILNFRDYFHLIHRLQLPEIQGDIKRRGLYWSGGNSQVYHMDKCISKSLDLEVFPVPDPAESVIRGMGEMLKDKRLLKLGDALGNVK
jgi:rod shape-determining protein MreB